jgi:hypothetical protein
MGTQNYVTDLSFQYYNLSNTNRISDVITSVFSSSVVDRVFVTLSCVLWREAAKTNFILLVLTRQSHEHTIYHTRGEHASNYITDSVCVG